MDISQEELKRSILSLLRLQEIDGELFRLNEEIENPPQDFVRLKENLEDLEKQLQAAERSFRQYDRERRALELKFLTLQEDLRKSETRRKEVRNTKEEFASGKEVENFHKRVQEAKKLLDERESVSAQKAKIVEEKRSEYEKVAAEYKEKSQKRNEHVQGLQDQKSKLLSNRKEHTAQVHDEVFSMYERIQKLRRGSGVAIVKGGICTGCFVTLPPQLVSRLQKLDKVMTCSSCSRILFPEALLESEDNGEHARSSAL